MVREVAGLYIGASGLFAVERFMNKFKESHVRYNLFSLKTFAFIWSAVCAGLAFADAQRGFYGYAVIEGLLSLVCLWACLISPPASLKRK